MHENLNNSKPTPLLAIYRRLLQRVGRQAEILRHSIRLLFLSSVLQGLALAALFPIFSSIIVARDHGSALLWSAAMSVISLASLLCRWRAQGFDYLGHTSRSAHDLRLLIGEKLRAMPILELEKKRTGETNSTILSNVDNYLQTTIMITDLIFASFVTPIVVGLALCFWDFWLGLFLIFLVVSVWPIYRWRRQAYARARRASERKFSAMSADCLEFTQGLQVLHNTGWREQHVQALNKSFEAFAYEDNQWHRWQTWPNLVNASWIELGLIAIVGAAIAFAIGSDQDVATAAALAVIFARLPESITNLSTYMSGIELSEAALQTIDDLLALPALPQTKEEAPTRFQITFEDVSFTYPGEVDPALQNLSFVLPEGSFTAITGTSGSGKTTLARLLQRHFDPDVGRILIGSAEVNAMPPRDVNALVSVVFQDVHLFDDTVWNNIRIAKPDATEAEIEEAADLARCRDFIEQLPKGRETFLGEKGQNLSGGERQRIAIARALLKDAPILILDEITAALDPQNAALVHQAIDALVENRTVLMISHQLAAGIRADKILVFKDGLLIDEGCHADLLRKNETFAEMWRAHSSGIDWRLRN